MSAPAEPSAPRAQSAVLALLGAFVLGMIAGGAVLYIARMALPPPPFGPRPPGPPPIRRLEQELGLDREQVEKLRVILDENRTRMREQADATRARIREILTPEQRARFDRMKPPPPPPGFPPPPPGGPGAPPPEGDGPPPGGPSAPR